MSMQSIKVIHLPQNVIHWNSHVNSVRALLSQSRSTHSINVPNQVAGGSGSGGSGSGSGGSGSGSGSGHTAAATAKVQLSTELLWKYDFSRPDWFPESDWNTLQTALFTSLFLGIPMEFKWLTSTVTFGDGKGLLDKLKDLVGSVDVQKARIEKQLAENILLSMPHYPCWYGTFRDLYASWNDIPGLDERDQKIEKDLVTSFIKGIATMFPVIVSSFDARPANEKYDLDTLHTMCESAVGRAGFSMADYTTGKNGNEAKIANVSVGQIQERWNDWHDDNHYDQGENHNGWHSDAFAGDNYPNEYEDYGPFDHDPALNPPPQMAMWGGKGGYSNYSSFSRGKGGKGRYSNYSRSWNRRPYDRPGKGKGKGKGKGNYYSSSYPFRSKGKGKGKGGYSNSYGKGNRYNAYLMLQDQTSGEEFVSYDGEVDSSGNENVWSDYHDMQQVNSSVGMTSTGPNLANVGVSSSNSLSSNTVAGSSSNGWPWVTAGSSGSGSNPWGTGDAGRAILPSSSSTSTSNSNSNQGQWWNLGMVVVQDVMAMLGDMSVNNFRKSIDSKHRICVDSGCNFLAIFYSLDFFPAGVASTHIPITGVTGEGNAVGQGVAVFYSRNSRGEWCRFVLDGAALQESCPVNLLAMDALHFSAGVRTGNTCNFADSMITMYDNVVFDLPRDDQIRLHFLSIVTENEFMSMTSDTEDVVVTYCF